MAAPCERLDFVFLSRFMCKKKILQPLVCASHLTVLVWLKLVVDPSLKEKAVDCPFICFFFLLSTVLPFLLSFTLYI